MALDDAAHRELLEAAALYAAGALPDTERRLFEAHASDCAACVRELRSFGAAIVGLALAVPQVDPPASLRARIVGERRGANAIRPAARPRARWSAGWLSAAALLAIGLGLAAYTTALRRDLADLEERLQQTARRLDDTERRLDAATGAVRGAELRMAVLMAPDLARIDLAGQTAAPRAAGRAFWSRAHGLVFAASALPPLPAGRTYQVWVVTAARPISAGTVRPDDRGAVTTFFPTAPDIPPPVAMAVTIEPDGGVPSPTGEKYLVGAAH